MIKKISVWLVCLIMLTGKDIMAGGLFPELEGWEIMQDENVYTPNDLWELINGAAEGFIDYGFAELHIAEYIQDDKIVRVEIYDHILTQNAYGMYSSERMPDYPQVAIGAQGYKSEGVLNFFKGRYYVKLMTIGPVKVAEETIALIASELDSFLDEPESMPQMVALLPEENRIFLSDSYVVTNFMGYSFLHSAYKADYDVNGKFTMFIIKAGEEDVNLIINSYSKTVKEDNVDSKNGYYIIRDPYNGVIYLSAANGYLVGVVDPADESTAIEYINKVIQKTD